MDIRPNHTIYINNVNDKIKKEGKCYFQYYSPLDKSTSSLQNTFHSNLYFYYGKPTGTHFEVNYYFNLGVSCLSCLLHFSPSEHYLSDLYSMKQSSKTVYTSVKPNISAFFCRAEESALRFILPVWPGYGYCCSEDREDEGPGVCYIQRACSSHKRPQTTSRISFLQQAHGQ